MHPKTERKMELRQLKYFIKVAELSSFSEASRQLNITQSTISQQIKQLEDELQVSLLIRTSHPLLCLEGVPDLPVAPQDEAGLTKTFQTWPRGWFHIP